MFNGDFFEQLVGVSMDTPLAPILANIFLGYHEGKWIRNYEGNKSCRHKRYGDDTIGVLKKENEANFFLTHLSSKNKNLKFTLEMEKE